MFVRIWKQGQIPQEFKDNFITYLFKWSGVYHCSLTRVILKRIMMKPCRSWIQGWEEDHGHDILLNVIISFQENTEASIKSNDISSDPFHVKNVTKQRCVMAPVLFSIYFALILECAFADYCNGILLEFRTTGGQQRFKLLLWWKCF